MLGCVLPRMTRISTKVLFVPIRGIRGKKPTGQLADAGENRRRICWDIAFEVPIAPRSGCGSNLLCGLNKLIVEVGADAEIGQIA